MLLGQEVLVVLKSKWIQTHRDTHKVLMELYKIIIIIMFTAKWPPPGTTVSLSSCVCDCGRVFGRECAHPHTPHVGVCVCVMTRLRESVSSLHLPSPWWLTAELIPRLTPWVDWRAHVYTQTELTKGWNTFTGWWHQMIHSGKKALIVKHTQT